jgi:hypothetical protein
MEHVLPAATIEELLGLGERHERFLARGRGANPLHGPADSTPLSLVILGSSLSLPLPLLGRFGLGHTLLVARVKSSGRIERPRNPKL